VDFFPLMWDEKLEELFWTTLLDTGCRHPSSI